MRTQRTESRNTYTYTIENGRGFLLDVVSTEDAFEAWLYHEQYGIKDMMFGLLKSKTPSLQEALDVIEPNLHEYISDYASVHMTKDEAEEIFGTDTATIRITPAEYGFDYTMGDSFGEDFEEHFVITGNRDMNGFTGASWYQEAREIIKDIDLYIDDISDGTMEATDIEGITAENADALLQAYESMHSLDDVDGITDVLNVLHPDCHYVRMQIHGCTQGEWQNVICEEKDAECIDDISAFYWGEVSCLHYEEEDVWSVVSDDDLWTWERENTLQEHLRDLLDIDADASLEVYRQDGCTCSPRFERVC